MTAPMLRYELVNGAAFCPRHHKFQAASAHRSYLFMHDFMNRARPPGTIDLIRSIMNVSIEINETYLINKLIELEREYEMLLKEHGKLKEDDEAH